MSVTPNPNGSFAAYYYTYAALNTPHLTPMPADNPTTPSTTPTNAPDDVRPWGAYWVLEDAPTHKVKRLQVTPGERLSLQYHHHRQEYWLVIAGVATVTVDDRTWQAPVGETIHIPQGAKHRLGNEDTEPVEIIEVQLGSYFGEDDIVRLQDDYQRNAP